MAARPIFQPGPARDRIYTNVRDYPGGGLEELWLRYARICRDNLDHF